jgi:tetratricopeptide (TPR) repeat protein
MLNNPTKLILILLIVLPLFSFAQEKRLELVIGNSKFENDTTTHLLLGDIYEEKKDYLKAIKHYQGAISIMEFNLAYQSIDPDYYPVFLSDCYAKLGDIYAILNDKELVCENYRNAIIALVDETRPDKIELEKILQEKLSQHCK